jgi:hypothetical protein
MQTAIMSLFADLVVVASFTLFPKLSSAASCRPQHCCPSQTLRSLLHSLNEARNTRTTRCWTALITRHHYPQSCRCLTPQNRCQRFLSGLGQAQFVQLWPDADLQTPLVACTIGAQDQVPSSFSEQKPNRTHIYLPMCSLHLPCAAKLYAFFLTQAFDRCSMAWPGAQ